MELENYKAEDLFEWVSGQGYNFTLLDVVVMMQFLFM